MLSVVCVICVQAIALLTGVDVAFVTLLYLQDIATGAITMDFLTSSLNVPASLLLRSRRLGDPSLAPGSLVSRVCLILNRI